MILKALFDFVLWLVSWFMSLLPSTPDVSGMASAFDTVLGYIQPGINIFYYFVPSDCIDIAFISLIASASFDWIVALVTWVIRKIPFLNIS